MPARRSRRRPVHRNPPRGGAADEHAATELVLYAENDADPYRQMRRPIELNLIKKYKAGKYNRELAVKLWGYLADEAAKRYAKEYGSNFSYADRWNVMFTPATRRLAATEMRDTWENEMRHETKKK